MLSVRSFRFHRPTNVPKIVLPDDGQPLDIEIGCGVGWHPITRSQQFPKRRIVAIEHTKERYQKFVSRLERHEPFPNLNPIHANAVSWIAENVSAETVDHYFLLYPNPHPKDRHLNRRWHAMPFAQDLVRTLKRGGELTLATNLSDYAEEAIQHYTRNLGLRLMRFRPIHQKSVPRGFPRTHFEKKYLDRGDTCWDMVFQKPYSSDASHQD